MAECDIMKTVRGYEYGEKDEIGRGNFGKVFKGHIIAKSSVDLENKRKSGLPQVVAIKEVDLKSVKNSPETIQRETDILNKLSSQRNKNIVTLLQSETQADRAYLFMEFCNGGNLQEYLQNKQKLDERTISIFVRQIAAGLKVAHDMHIVHRDLKPENILLCFHGSKYPSPDKITLKIADFGVGRFLSSDGLATSLCGSPLYMAPEIVQQNNYDNKADLWSVGVISYECFVGSLPENKPLAFSNFTFPTNASSNFADFLRGLLEKDTNKRFSSKQFFNHEFLAAIISVDVLGPDNDTATIHVKDNLDVDLHLIDVVYAKYSTDSRSSYLLNQDCVFLKRGSGKSIREFGIVHCNTLVLVMRVPGGNDNDLKVALDCSS